MLMKPNAKKSATLVIQKLRNHANESAKPAADINGSEDVNPKVIAAEEVLSAIEMKDARALADAMSYLMEMCDMEEDASESESEVED